MCCWKWHWYRNYKERAGVGPFPRDSKKTGVDLTKRSCGYDPVRVGKGWDGKGYQIRLKLSEIPSLTVLRNFHTTINAKRK